MHYFTFLRLTQLTPSVQGNLCASSPFPILESTLPTIPYLTYLIIGYSALRGFIGVRQYVIASLEPYVSFLKIVLSPQLRTLPHSYHNLQSTVPSAMH